MHIKVHIQIQRQVYNYFKDKNSFKEKEIIGHIKTYWNPRDHCKHHDCKISGSLNQHLYCKLLVHILPRRPSLISQFEVWCDKNPLCRLSSCSFHLYHSDSMLPRYQLRYIYSYKWKQECCKLLARLEKCEYCSRYCCLSYLKELLRLWRKSITNIYTCNASCRDI